MRLHGFRANPARARRVAGNASHAERIVVSSQGAMSCAIRAKMHGGRVMASRETFAKREKRELDLQLDEELKGTFPASDPLKITRCSAKSSSVAEAVPKKNAAVRKNY